MKKSFTTDQAIAKIQKYCVYQERCHSEVRGKLFDYGLKSSDVDEIITGLIVSGFLNEERYAKAFAGGKFRMKKWGRLKIVHALEANGVSKNCIKAGLKEIADDDYEKALREILEKKNSEIEMSNIYSQRDKVSRFAIQRGYEPDLVWKMLREILPE